MKILYISSLPPPVGGISLWGKRIMEQGLPGNYLISFVNTKLQQDQRIFEKRIRPVSEFKRTCRIIGSLVKNLFFNTPDIVHLNCSLSSEGVFRDLFLAAIIKISRIPLIAHYHGDLPNFSNRACFGLSYAVLKTIIKISDVNIALNQPSFKFLSKLRQEDKQQIVCVPNFIEDEIFKYSKDNNAYQEKVTNIVFVGAVTRVKGFFEIIEISKAFPEIHFDLIGHITKESSSFLKNKPFNLSLHGEKSHDIVIKKMTESDCFLFPSHSEGFPNAVLEAMAIGLPVIATKVGAIPEMVSDQKGGMLVEKGDVKGMINGINLLIKNPTLMKRMGIYNKNKARQNYSYSVVIKTLVKIYKNQSK